MFEEFQECIYDISWYIVIEAMLLIYEEHNHTYTQTSLGAFVFTALK